jgi:Flp pilus assembly protein TadD
VTKRGPQQSALPNLHEGFRLHQSGDLRGAERYYRLTLKKDKKNTEALYLLGSLYSQTGDLKQAESILSAALAEQPHHIQALYNLSRVFMDSDRCEEAAGLLFRTLSLQPENISALRNLGVVYLRLGRPRDAAPPLEKAIALDPSSAETWCDLGLARSQMGNDKDAAEAFHQALLMDPDLARARHNRGHLRLRQANFLEGWLDYEARKLDPKSGFEPRPFSYPTWQGEDLAGKSILVVGEQGLGDQILYASMLPELSDRADHVVLECEFRLQPLFARSFPKISVLPSTQPPQTEIFAANPDAQVAIGSLGQWLRPDLNSFPQRNAYLRADPKRRNSLNISSVFQRKTRPRIGLSWQSARLGLGPHKSSNLVRDWGAVFQVLPDATYISLQYGAVDDDISAATAQFGVSIGGDHGVDVTKDIDGLAALISELDLVITTSNTTAHLAGALGVPVWCLAPLGVARLWYWFNPGFISPWYPNMKLYWQSSAGDWSGVFDQVAADLREHNFDL